MAGAAGAWLGPAIHWLAMQPPLEAILQDLVASPTVQMTLATLVGHEVVTPEMLLSAMLAFFITSLILLSFVHKARLAAWGFWYFFASGDKKVRKPNDVRIDFSAKGTSRVKVIFIRHGESEWNWVFNKGPILVRPFRLLLSLVREARMFFEQDSLFLDSPLSTTGIQQAWDMLTFIASQPAGCVKPEQASRPAAELEVADFAAIVRGDVGSSVVVSSILRRAISTGVIGLSPRLLKTPSKDKVLLMTCLQEISRNVDTLSLTPSKTLPCTPAAEATMKNMGDLVSHFYRTRLDKKYNFGNKTMQQKAMQRHSEFTRWIFDQKNETVIVCGHSLWFREFFKSYLPKASPHIAKQKKMENCAIVAFDLYRSASSPTSEAVIKIDATSIKEVYLGFESKQKKKKA